MKNMLDAAKTVPLLAVFLFLMMPRYYTFDIGIMDKRSQ